MQKKEILEAILKNFNVKLRKSDYSSGSTITLSGLERTHKLVCPRTWSSANTKSEHVRGMLLKLNLDISDSDVSAGGTVTKSALLSILNALESRNQF